MNLAGSTQQTVVRKPKPSAEQDGETRERGHRETDQSSNRQSPSTRVDWVLVLLILAAVTLLFTRLDDIYLWQDEAETAVLARNVLDYGYPRAFDGTHLPFAGIRAGYAWVFHSWLQFYLTAASFLMFGMTTWAARLPFVLFGVGSVVLTWVLAKHLFRDRQICVIATFLLITAVPFVLHMRQCRYYAPMVFFTLWSLLAYWQWLHGTPRAALWWLIGMLMLLHTNWMASIPLLVACTGHWLWSGERAHVPRATFIRWAGLFVALSLPWLIYARVWEHGVRGLSLTDIRHNIEFYFKMINSYVLPLVTTAVVIGIQWVRRRVPSFPPTDRMALSLLGWTIGATLLTVAFGRQHYFRYIIALLPLLYLLAAWGLVRWCAVRPIVLIGVLAILTTTNLLQRPDRFFNGQPRSYLADYVHELTHEAPDSTRGIVRFLNAHASPGETVKIRYSVAPLLFYTPLIVEINADKFFEVTYPDWIVLQYEWIPESFYTSAYFASILSQYERFVTDIPDYLWGNPPDPYLHLFRTPTHLPGVQIYRKRSDA